jgi:hypothetical protein
MATSRTRRRPASPPPQRPRGRVHAPPAAAGPAETQAPPGDGRTRPGQVLRSVVDRLYAIDFAATAEDAEAARKRALGAVTDGVRRLRHVREEFMLQAVGRCDPLAAAAAIDAACEWLCAASRHLLFLDLSEAGAAGRGPDGHGVPYRFVGMPDAEAEAHRLIDRLGDIARLSGQADAVGRPEEPGLPAIVSHGDRVYSVPGADPVLLTYAEDKVLQAMLDWGKPAHFEKLKELTGMENVPRVLRTLQASRGGLFRSAIALPGKKSRDGYRVRIVRGPVSK